MCGASTSCVSVFLIDGTESVCVCVGICGTLVLVLSNSERMVLVLSNSERKDMS